MTLLPSNLARQHGVSLAAVEHIALEHVKLEGEQNLFRFYDQPEDWQETSVVADLCASLPGVFDIEKVKAKLPMAKSFLGVELATC